MSNPPTIKHEVTEEIEPAFVSVDQLEDSGYFVRVRKCLFNPSIFQFQVMSWNIYEEGVEKLSELSLEKTNPNSQSQF